MLFYPVFQRRTKSQHYQKMYTVGHDDVIKWKHFPRYWPFVRGIHRSPVNSPHQGQWRGALTFSLICLWINGWVNNPEACDKRRYRAHYDVIVMIEPIKYSVDVTDIYRDPSRLNSLDFDATLISRLMGPTWAHLRPAGPRWAPCWPHELCDLGSDVYTEGPRPRDYGSDSIIFKTDIFVRCGLCGAFLSMSKNSNMWMENKRCVAAGGR